MKHVVIKEYGCILKLGSLSKIDRDDPYLQEVSEADFVYLKTLVLSDEVEDGASLLQLSSVQRKEALKFKNYAGIIQTPSGTYIRVSSLLQNSERQLADVELDRIFEDRVSGKDRNRPALNDCLDYVREGDQLFVHSIDRLARNLKDLQSIVEGLSEKGVSVHFMKENLIFDRQVAPLQKLMFQMLGAFGEFERNLIRERQAEGIAIAKQKGKYKGRKRALSDEQVAHIKNRMSCGEKVSHLAREYGVSRVTIYKSVDN